MAKVRYMIDYVFDEKRDARGENAYVPCGVWAISETQFEVGVLEDDFPERSEEMHWFINDLVEKGIKPHKVEGFMEYWRDSRSPYRGMFSEIVETDEFEHAVQCVNALLERLRNEKTG